MTNYLMIGKITTSGVKFVLTRGYTWVSVKDFLKGNIKPYETYDINIPSLMLEVMTNTECGKGDILHMVRFKETNYASALRKWVTKNSNITQNLMNIIKEQKAIIYTDHYPMELT